MVGAQFVMVAMMTMTPVHMRMNDHGLGLVGFVISAHIAGMYALSPLGGLLVDRLGAPTTLWLRAAVLAAAGLLGALAPGDSVVLLTLALSCSGSAGRCRWSEAARCSRPRCRCRCVPAGKATPTCSSDLPVPRAGSGPGWCWPWPASLR